jgi:hypothetical protein
MPKTPKPRPVLDQDARNRFTVDKKLLRRVYNYLKSCKEPDALELLPGTKDQLAQCKNRQATVAALLVASGRFDVEGFSVTNRGLQWAEQPRVPVLLRPYAYLSHLLRMSGDTVELLFGPQNLNDMMMHQWDPLPKTAHGLLMTRLDRYFREGTAVCSL